MTPVLLDLLCDPVTQGPLILKEGEYRDGSIVSGWLESEQGRRYPIVDGIPRFTGQAPSTSVTSFGDEWNHFNFVEFKDNWLQHTVKNTFGSVQAFEGKIVVDAGAGSGSQSLWMLESGARHVIALELSHSVDDVMLRNIDRQKWPNVDIVQCSIDAPPLRSRSIDGIVICHNVIQHTPSVEKTAQALFQVVGPGGQFVFNCYPLNDRGLLRWIRWHGIYLPLRSLLSRLPFGLILGYARTTALLRLIPGVGELLEKLHICFQGDVPVKPESRLSRLKRRFRATALNTFDAYGSHSFQHHKSDAEITELVNRLQPDPGKVLNREAYFRHPTPIGCALRLFR